MAHDVDYLFLFFVSFCAYLVVNCNALDLGGNGEFGSFGLDIIDSLKFSSIAVYEA